MSRVRSWRRSLIAGLVAFFVLLAGQVVVAPAASASSVGGPISRAEVLERANYWVARNVPYSQASWAPDVNGRNYRQDCSGFLSMAWHLSSSPSTSTLAAYGNRLGSIDDLQPGDMLLRAGDHVVLFVRWNNTARTSATIWHESKPGVGTVAATYTRAMLNGFVPYSYKNIVNSGAPDPNPGTSTREVFESASNNGWNPLATGVAGDALATMTMDGVKYVYTVRGGQVYEAASNNGWQNLNTGISSSGPLAVMAMGGVKYVYTINGGQVYEAASNNGWTSLNSGIQGGIAVSAINVGGVKIVYTR